MYANQLDAVSMLTKVQKHSENSETIQQLGQRIETIARIVDMNRDKSDANLNKSLQVLAGWAEVLCRRLFHFVDLPLDS
jgi:hypothetical protein